MSLITCGSHLSTKVALAVIDKSLELRKASYFYCANCPTIRNTVPCCLSSASFSSWLLSPFSTTAVAASSEAYPTIPGTVDTSFPSSDAPDDLIPPRCEVFGGGRIFDITHRITSSMLSSESGDALGQFLWLPRSIKNGSLANNSVMKLPTHTGTHVDAPGHIIGRYFDAGFDVDTLDLEVLNGPALLIDVPRNTNITAEAMKSLHIPKGVRRVLFRALNTDRCPRIPNNRNSILASLP